MKKAFTLITFTLISFLFFPLNLSSAFAAEEYVYSVVCEPKQTEDVARVIRGHIWLALRSDPTVSQFSIEAKILKLPKTLTTQTQSELLKDLPFYFNSSDLSVSVGTDAVNFSCLAPAQLRIKVQVTRKDGTNQVNDINTQIRVPGTYATKSKVKSPIR